MAKFDFVNSKAGRFIKGNGFYIALAVCLAGAGVASWAAINASINNLTTENPAVQSEEDDAWEFPQVEEARGNEEKLPIKNEATSSLPQSNSQLSQQPQSELSHVQEEQPDILKPAAPQQKQQSLLFVLPVSGEIIDVFSNGELVHNKTMNDWRTHNGIDIKAKAATPVKAVTDGEVTKIYTDGMWGTVVEITHANGMISRYSSLTEQGVTVAVGDTVEIGEVIGCVGETAEAEIALPTHLHFEIIKDGEYLDPISAMEIDKEIK